MSVGGHLNALLLKNWLLWKRELCGSICEILFPILVTCFLYLIKIAIGTTNKQAFSFLYKQNLVAPFDVFMNNTVWNDTLHLSEYQLNDSYPFQWCQKVLKYQWQWAAVYDKSDQQSSDIMSYVEPEIWKYFEFVNLKNPEKIPQPIYFESQSKLDHYITSSSYGEGDNHKLCFAIEFENSASSSLTVNIRYNITDTDPEHQKCVWRVLYYFPYTLHKFSEYIPERSDYEVPGRLCTKWFPHNTESGNKWVD